MRLAQKRARFESNLSSGATIEEEEGDDGGDSDSDEESSAKARYFGYIKQGLYYVTEMERFAPPRKRPRTVAKNYRLVSLRSTTPEELYQRKVGGIKNHYTTLHFNKCDILVSFNLSLCSIFECIALLHTEDKCSNCIPQLYQALLESCI